MAPIRNAQIVFKEKPEGFPVPGQHTEYSTSETIDIDNVPLEKGSVLLETLVLSIDPSIRGRMRRVYEPGKPITNFGLVKVIRSENDDIKQGDILEGMIDFAEYRVHSSPSTLRLIKNRHDLPLSLYTGILGMPGKTAYFGWKEYANPKKGDTVFVTTGAGPVGSLVIQLAKLLHPDLGLKIIASAGSDDKVEWMKSIGVDVAFNYKTQNTAEVLAKEGPINIYWDHVGGEILDAVLENSAPHGRIILCGAISSYNSGYRAPVTNLFQSVYKMLTIHGLFIFNPFLVEKWNASFEEVFPKLVSEGKIKWTEDKRYGLDKAEQAILDQQLGKNNGKLVVVVSEE